MNKLQKYVTGGIMAAGVGAIAFTAMCGVAFARTYDTIQRGEIEITSIDRMEAQRRYESEEAAQLRLDAIKPLICSDNLVTKMGMYTHMALDAVVSSCPVSNLLEIVSFPYVMEANRHKICNPL